MTLTTRKVRDGVSERETTQSEAQDDGRVETRQHGYSMWDEMVPLQKWMEIWPHAGEALYPAEIGRWHLLQQASPSRVYTFP